jgi:hypothetical protein
MPKQSKEHIPGTTTNGKLSRRAFARNAALAVTTAAAVPSLLAQQAPAPKPSAAPDKPKPAQEALSPELQQEGELKFQWIMQRYGNRLSATHKEDIHRLIMEGQKPLAALRAFPVDNGDMPALVLKLTDAEAAGQGEAR